MSKLLIKNLKVCTEKMGVELACSYTLYQIVYIINPYSHFQSDVIEKRQLDSHKNVETLTQRVSHDFDKRRTKHAHRNRSKHQSLFLTKQSRPTLLLHLPIVIELICYFKMKVKCFFKGTLPVGSYLMLTEVKSSGKMVLKATPNGTTVPRTSALLGLGNVSGVGLIQQVIDVKNDNEALTRRVEDAEIAMDAYDAEVSEMDATITANGQTILGLRNERTTLAQQVDARNATINAQDIEIDNLKKTIAGLRKTITDQEKTIVDEMKAKDSEISKLKDRVKFTAKSNVDLNTKINSLNKDHKEEMEAATKKISSLKADNSSLKLSQKKAWDEAAKHHQEVETLQKSLAAKEGILLSFAKHQQTGTNLIRQALPDTEMEDVFVNEK